MLGPDIEGEAESILDEQAFALDEPPNIDCLARCVVGAANLIETRMLSAPACWVRATDEILVRPSLARVPRRWLVSHEIAERRLARSGYRGEDVEHLADALAAAILVPRRLMQAAVREYGRNLPTLAAALVVSQSIVALRLGEVTGSPLALVTPRAVHVRGEPWGWPDERAVRALARGPLPRELERVVVTDTPRRVVLAAA